jgi:hypothetical protein
MSISPEKRIFSHGGFTHTVTIWPSLEEQNTFVVHVDRSARSNARPDNVHQRTYTFSEFRHRFSPTEEQHLILGLHGFAKIMLERGEQLPDQLPDNWSKLADQRSNPTPCTCTKHHKQGTFVTHSTTRVVCSQGHIGDRAGEDCPQCARDAKWAGKELPKLKEITTDELQCVCPDCMDEAAARTPRHSFKQH